jgi:hypothetical protein
MKWTENETGKNFIVLDYTIRISAGTVQFTGAIRCVGVESLNAIACIIRAPV